jgi:hypothetical protein
MSEPVRPIVAAAETNNVGVGIYLLPNIEKEDCPIPMRTTVAQSQPRGSRRVPTCKMAAGPAPSLSRWEIDGSDMAFLTPQFYLVPHRYSHSQNNSDYSSCHNLFMITEKFPTRNPGDHLISLLVYHSGSASVDLYM